MLVILLKRQIKVTEVENELNNHNHDKYIDTEEFNKLAADVFNARLARANIVAKTEFDSKLSNLNRYLLKIKQIIYLFKMNLKNCKYLIQVILLVRIILKTLVHKII